MTECVFFPAKVSHMPKLDAMWSAALYIISVKCATDAALVSLNLLSVCHC